MSYSFNTGRVETSPVQNDSGSVSVAILGHSAGLADENPFREQQAGLGSRTATAARHRRVGGRHQHHLSARPLGILDQRRFRGADGSVSGLTRHPRLRQKLRLEVLNRQQPMAGNDFGGPLTRRVLPLPGDLLRQPRDNAFGAQVTLGRALATGGPAPRHRLLPTSKLSGSAPSMLRVRQIVFGVGGSRHGAHPPVDTDQPIAGLQRPVLALHHETGLPVPNAVAEYPHTARLGRQLPRPHDWDAQATGKTQTAISEHKSTFGVVQTRQAAFGGLELAPPLALGAFGPEVAQHLLLGHHRTLTQPVMLTPPVGQGVIANPLTRLIQAFDRPVPHPPAAIPLRQQPRHRDRARAQPVPIAHNIHEPDATAVLRQNRPILPGLERGASWAAFR